MAASCVATARTSLNCLCNLIFEVNWSKTFDGMLARACFPYVSMLVSAVTVISRKSRHGWPEMFGRPALKSGQVMPGRHHRRRIVFIPYDQANHAVLSLTTDMYGNCRTTSCVFFGFLQICRNAVSSFSAII